MSPRESLSHPVLPLEDWGCLCPSLSCVALGHLLSLSELPLCFLLCCFPSLRRLPGSERV